MIVPALRTPIPLGDLPHLLAEAYDVAFPSVVQASALPDAGRRIAIAQLVLEHGREGHRPDGALWNILCNNAGNQDAGHADLLPSPEASPVELFRTVAECEGTACQRRAQHVRRAYDTVEDGLAAYWLRLAEAYPAALAGLRGGSVEVFVGGLEARGYFTASAASYLTLLQELVREGERRGW